ncbi:hypothetical protein HD599_002060 [Conyzicola lurida]|uniref:Uncharacterized protein n=1 Tax=Conyzicola lurida TaxID=1172621 RepID=A0A841AKI6_9MICO|nr:hypothetical protein [Conyzicola lurida]MBB5843737.1 hypothetical protein [Conyzicola lurida]
MTTATCTYALGGWCVDWFSDFVMSSGFAGILAVVAAVVAYAAATRNASRERWWRRAESALNMTTSADKYIRLAGLEILGSMKTRDADERTFIRVTIKWFTDEALQRPTGEEEPHDDPAPKPLGVATRAGMRIDGFFQRPRR